jgi:type II secretory pathway pseudopilin PulG
MGGRHDRTVPAGGGPRKRRSGFVLVEATVCLSILAVLGILLLKLSLNVLSPRQWALQQALSDAYLTFERAFAERVPFDELTSVDSPWPAHPLLATQNVEIGRLPGGRVVTGTITRTRLADPENYPVDGGTGTTATNPAAMKVWRVQSVLRYEIGGRTYLKSRTVIRSQ